ncbi:MAG: LysR family transcriptional regulator [Hyphomicrobiales bacterium]
MIDQLRQLAIFASAVEHGSFRAAAKDLRLSPSVVSHHISQLEEKLGTPLMYRSTRKLRLTPEGERLCGAAQEMIEAAEAGLSDISDQTRQFSGLLRVTVPAVLAQSSLLDQFAAFTQKYPRAQLSVDFSDLRRELIADGFDVAIRMGFLKDSAYFARKLFDVDRILVASPDYLNSHATPQLPSDLSNWAWIELVPVSQQKVIFKMGAKTSTVSRPISRVNVNSAYALSRFARAGAGLAILPGFMVQQELSAGRLHHVLPDWTVPAVGVYAVWPPNVPKNGLVKSFVEQLS